MDVGAAVHNGGSIRQQGTHYGETLKHCAAHYGHVLAPQLLPHIGIDLAAMHEEGGNLSHVRLAQVTCQTGSCRPPWA